MLLYTYFDGEDSCYFKTIRETKHDIDELHYRGDQFTIEKIKTIRPNSKGFLDVLNKRGFVIERDEVCFYVSRGKSRAN